MSKAEVMIAVNKHILVRNGQKLTMDEAEIWWDCLKDYPVYDIKTALTESMKYTKGRLIPAHVVAHLPQKQAKKGARTIGRVDKNGLRRVRAMIARCLQKVN